MNQLEAKNIGTAFFRNTGFDIDYIDGSRDKLSTPRDHTIFYSFTILTEEGEGYLGGLILLIDKKTRFCLLVASSPNFYDYHVFLFRKIILARLHEMYGSIELYKKKKAGLEFGDYLNSIFLLLKSYPKNQNVFLEFLDILITLETESFNDPDIEKLYYQSVFTNSYTINLFCKSFQFLKSNVVVKPKIDELEKVLETKGHSVNSIFEKFNQFEKERLKEIEDLKKIIKEMDEENNSEK